MTVGGTVKTVGYDVTVSEVMETVNRDRIYYRRSGGGVTLSGGEMMRLKLAVLCNSPSNILILDEPTNHLDVKAKKALREALMNYEGALILVTHEPDFAEGLCDIIFDAKAK